jgi:signal transduction histidine kinase
MPRDFDPLPHPVRSRGVFFRFLEPLRGRVFFRILIPFTLIIVAGVSMALPYGVTTTDRLVEERINDQVDAVAGVVGNVIRQELDKLLTFCELKIYFAPIQEALNRHDLARLRQLIIPMKTLSRVDLVAIFDRDGKEILRLDHMGLMDKDLERQPIVGQGLSGQRSQGIITTENRMFMCAIAPNETSGVKGGMNGAMLVGQVVDDRFVELIKETAGIDLVISDQAGNIMASSLGDTAPFAPQLDLKRVAAELPGQGGRSRSTFTVNSVPFRAAHRVFSVYPGSWAIISVVMDISASATTKRKIITVMITLMCVGVAAAFIVSVVIARSISRPIKELVDATEGIASKNAAQRGQDVGGDEIGRLTQSFNAMIGRILQDMETISEARNKAQEYSHELEESNRELRRARRELIQASKLVAMGQLGAGIAHELNQPLLAIGLFAEQSLKYLSRESQEYRNVERIVGQVNRMSKIINQIRLFARQSVLEPQPIDISESVRKALALVERQLADANIDVTLTLTDHLPKVPADDNQLQQVFLNLITNARDAMLQKGAGRLAIESTALCGGQFVAVDFSDNGVGISPETLNEIFLPFFTTKKDLKGMGLGLSISYGIIERHNGVIRVHSTPGEGTTFRVILPTVNARPCWEEQKCGEKDGGRRREECPIYTKDQGFACWLYHERAGNDDFVRDHCQECAFHKVRESVISGPFGRTPGEKH